MTAPAHESLRNIPLPLVVEPTESAVITTCRHRRRCARDAGPWLSVYCMTCGQWIVAIPIDTVEVGDGRL